MNVHEKRTATYFEKFTSQLTSWFIASKISNRQITFFFVYSICMLLWRQLNAESVWMHLISFALTRPRVWIPCVVISLSRSGTNHKNVTSRIINVLRIGTFVCFCYLCSNGGLQQCFIFEMIMIHRHNTPRAAAQISSASFPVETQRNFAFPYTKCIRILLPPT